MVSLLVSLINEQMYQYILTSLLDPTIKFLLLSAFSQRDTSMTSVKYLGVELFFMRICHKTSTHKLGHKLQTDVSSYAWVRPWPHLATVCSSNLPHHSEETANVWILLGCVLDTGHVWIITRPNGNVSPLKSSFTWVKSHQITLSLISALSIIGTRCSWNWIWRISSHCLHHVTAQNPETSFIICDVLSFVCIDLPASLTLHRLSAWSQFNAFTS